MKLQQNLRPFFLATACLLNYFQVAAGGRTLIKNVRLGRESISIANGAFSISSINSFSSVSSESQVDIALRFECVASSGAFHWPEITVDSVLFGGAEHIYINALNSEQFSPREMSDSPDHRNLMAIASRSEVFLFGLYRYLSPVELYPGKYGIDTRNNFMPGILRPGEYKIYTTIKTTRQTESLPVLKDVVCFSVMVEETKLSKDDLAYINEFQARFAKLKVTEYSKSLPSVKSMLPLQDRNFLDGMIFFASKSLANKKLMLAASSAAFLRQDRNKYYYKGSDKSEFNRNDLFLNAYVEWVAEVYTIDSQLALLLILEGPPVQKKVMLSRVGLVDDKSFKRNVVPKSFFKSK